MTGRPEMPTGDPAEQAIYWLTWLTSGEAGKEQRRAFEAWLNEKPSHREAWENANALWRDIDRLDEKDLTRGVPAAKTLPAQRRRTNLAFTSFATAVCVLLLLVVGATEFPILFADYRTGTGENRTIVLSDGSKILLNTDTALSVNFSDTARRLILHEGEAWFRVAPDAERPFEVATEQGTVRALGTAFDVYRSDDLVTVTVYEHAVEVRLSDGQTLDAVNQGSAVSFGRSAADFDRRTDLAKTAAWHRGEMVFKGRRLDQVIEELNRYRKGRIVIADPSLNDLPLTGVFDTGNPEEALDMIRQGLKLSEFRITERLVFLYRS